MLPGELVGALYISAGKDHTKNVDVAALKAMPHKTVSFHNVHTKADETYSGVPLIDLLASLGVPHGKELHGKGLSDYIVRRVPMATWRCWRWPKSIRNFIPAM